MRHLILSFFLVFLLASCAPRQFVPREIPALDFEKTPPYEIDLSKFPKPAMIDPWYMDGGMEPTSDPDEAAYVVLVPKEYAKIEALLRILKGYKDTIKEQEVLINADIRIINSLKEFLELERQKLELYRELWADSENLYRQERYYHTLDNVINRGALGVITVGSIVLFVLAL